MPSSADLHLRLKSFLAERESELIDLHRALVRIPTVNTGDGSMAREDRLAEALASWLGRLGIESRAPAPEPGRASLVAEVAGHADGPALLLMSHADVVPVGDDAAWTHPPFSAALEDGRIWGRGANDCKMLVAAQAFALACLKRLDLPGRGRVRLIVGADEETGGRRGFGWLAREHPELVRADLAICEGGGASLGRLGGDRTLVSIGCGEKGRYDITFTCRGEGGHAATPWGRLNPVAQLGRLLERIAAWQPEAAPASPVFAHLGALIDLPGGIARENLEEALARIDRIAPSFGRSLRAQSRMTFTPTVIHGGEGSNVIPTEARLVCDSRLLPGQTRQDLDAVIQSILAQSATSTAAGSAVRTSSSAGTKSPLDVSVAENAPPSRCDLPEPLRELFESAASRAAGRPVRAVPTWCTGATDAHWVRAVGTPVYGFQFIHPDADATRLGIHCIDESIEAAMLLPCALSLAHFAVDFLDAPIESVSA